MGIVSYTRTMYLGVILLLMVVYIHEAECQSYRHFPPLFNLAKERPVVSTPQQSSCGYPKRSTFCRSSTSVDSVDNCVLDYCDQDCPLRYELADHQDLLNSPGIDDCVTRDTINKVERTNFSASFTNESNCFLSPASVELSIGDSGQFTFTTWLRQQTGNVGTILDKQDSNGGMILRVIVANDVIVMEYSTASGAQSIRFDNNFIPSNTWTHISLQVYDRFINLFINGTEIGSSPTSPKLLSAAMQDAPGGSVRIGQSFSGNDQFIGNLQDIRFYSIGLSNREIDEIVTGVLPSLHTQSACRCPPSHPRVKPYLSRYCIKNGMGDTTSDQQLRLGSFAHPLEFLNDGDTNSIWISAQMSQVSLTVDLADTFQVFYVVMQFYSPLPRAVRIQRLSGDVWSDWQFYSEDCMSYYGVENNGPLDNPSSVNCLQLSTVSQELIPYSRGNITFNILSQAPVARPGHNDFYNTPELYDFVTASKVRVLLEDHFYATHPRHQYYGIYEFLVTGRCDCNGHAETCDSSNRPYICDCSPESYTTGLQCASCLSLYNDKPFRVGDQVNSHACKPCNCYSHATSCVYNATLDPFPADRNRGGGGQCINCQHNTRGINCEQCAELYYRDLSKTITDPEACQPCQCDSRGTVNGATQCAEAGGQCPCKPNVTGRKCDMCLPGTYNLVTANPSGCTSCSCDEKGVKFGDMNCDEDGACSCKDNVRGDKCSLCDYGYYDLSTNNTLGCTPCDCDPRGARSQFCDPDDGLCLCKTNVIGNRCGECDDGFWDLPSFCLPCSAHCDVHGTESGTSCDKSTGQCVCKVNTQGFICDQCRPGYYSFGSSSQLGCLPCACNTDGTVNGSNTCNATTGQCECKENVQGLTCNECKANTYGLASSDPLGCQSCDCDPTGTLHGTSLLVEELPCDQNTGECTCLSNRINRRCDSCEATFYMSQQLGGGCLNCGCHDSASVSQVCDLESGQCSCKLGFAGVTGRQCNECNAGYYNFNDRQGICTSCDCSPAGSINGTCNMNTGQCDCKLFVTGQACDQCVSGASDLSQENPYGCSKFPSQQPPPTHEAISSTALQLIWAPPDYPNGIIITYFLFRDNIQIAAVDPSGLRYNDTGLMPYTSYEYYVQARNEHGYADSPPVTFRTPPGSPSGDITLNVFDVTAYGASFSWNALNTSAGPIDTYILSARTDLEPETTMTLFNGLEYSSSTESLTPYTNYTFTVSACTTGGCSSSEAVWILTNQAAPSGQQDPIATALSSTSLYIQWSPPLQPNGVIIYYELWMQGTLQIGGVRDPPPAIIFQPSGQYNPRPADPLENALTPPATNYTVTGLTPHTEYEFQILSQNDINKAASNWVSVFTLEDVPVSMPSPMVTPLNSTALYIQWIEPSKEEINGVVTLYRLLQVFATNLEANPFDPPTYSMEIFSSTNVKEFTLTGLNAFSEYKVKVQVCNAVGCVDSETVTGRTLAAAPSNVEFPLVTAVNSSTMSVQWEEPVHLNGPPPLYKVIRSEVAFSDPPPRVIKGTRFPGEGYYLFPPATVPQGVAFTGVDFWFKTTQWDGLLLFLASEGNQDEFLAVQLRSGRPWLLFDPQGCSTYVSIDPETDNNATYSDDLWHNLKVIRSGVDGSITIDSNVTGCTTTVTSTDDEGLPYNDNQWHYLYAFRNDRVGYVALDGVYSGTKTSSCSTGTIIGSNTGVYIGGLPRDFIIRRNELDPRARVIRRGFQGCLGEVRILQQQSPEEIWLPMSWESAIEKRDSYPTWHGCPINIEYATHFPGRGWVEIDGSLVTQNSLSTEIEMSVRTQYYDGLLFFVYGGKNVYMYAQIRDGAVEFAFRQDDMATEVTFRNSEVVICEGQWKKLLFVKSGHQLTIQVESQYTAQNGTALSVGVNLASNLYLGGIPPDGETAEVLEKSGLSLVRPLGGCIKDLRINRRRQDVLSLMVNMSAVNLDGCPEAKDSPVPCKQNHEEQIFSGDQNNTMDIGLTPFTDYMYKVTANNSGGESSSPWALGTTREAPPDGVDPPDYARSVSGYRIEVKWHHPSVNTGLILQYTLRAHDMSGEKPIVKATFMDSTILEGFLEGTIPFTAYAIYLEACTLAGCTQSSTGLDGLLTLEERPSEVSAPTVISNSPSHIFIGWDEPIYPNGPITGYVLLQNDKEVYSGGEQFFNFTDLQAFTSYPFTVRACTVIGCTDSQVTQLSTAQLAPSFVAPPQLIVYGTRRIDVQWLAPERLNGILESYLIYMSTSIDMLGELVYNSSDVGFLTYRNESLLAGTTYYVSLGACTGGGCTISSQANATTVESSPDGVLDPIITPLSPYDLMVTWEPPTLPNGIVTSYSLTHNSVPVTVDGLAYNATELLPYSLHTFQLTVCTSKGCTPSNEVTGRTLEAPPEGAITLEIERPITEPRQVTLRWTRVQTPNGITNYTVSFDGLFYQDTESEDYTPYRIKRNLLSTLSPDQWYTVSGVIPFSQYSVQVIGSNTAGFVNSNIESVDMPPGSPDGVSPPELTAQSSSSVLVVWGEIGRVNAPSTPGVLFQLFYKQAGSDQQPQQLFTQNTAATSYTHTGLEPFTEYEYRVMAYNGYGSTFSDWISVYTLQDVPAQLDPPLVVYLSSRYVTLSWEHPTNPNGIITDYKIYSNDSLSITVASNTTRVQVDDLMPYTGYIFRVEACTSAGCTSSPDSESIITRQDSPEGLSAPTVTSLGPTSVLITWSSPSSPNGLIIDYTVERQVDPTSSAELVLVDGMANRQYVDESNQLQPFTEYNYRISARTVGGRRFSSWSSVRTQSARPSGLAAPEVNVQSATNAHVSWQPPQRVNGLLDRYIVSVNDQRIVITDTEETAHNLTQLTAYFNYSISITACTDGGCTESPTVQVQTPGTIPGGVSPPQPIALSQTFIAVQWQAPTHPNGPNIRYSLIRMKIRQPLDNSGQGFHVWTEVYSGTELYYEDRGVTVYTSYLYRLTVYNELGFLTSDNSSLVITHAGQPQEKPALTASPVSHTEILANWTLPDEGILQGFPVSFILNASGDVNISLSYPPDTRSAQVNDLSPNQVYSVTVTVILNGGAGVNSDVVTVTTADGAPQGVSAPQLFVVDDSSIRVSWISPTQPNGEITAYKLYVDDVLITEVDTDEPGSYVLTGLVPYTVYNIKIEVCTVYACVQSAVVRGITSEAQPQGLTDADIRVLSSSRVQISWTPPERPNGILTDYKLFRRNITDCASLISDVEEISKCSYKQCAVLDAVCGGECYGAGKVCCVETIHNVTSGYECCDNKYIARSQTDDVCCGGTFHTRKDNYQCCGTNYVQVLPEEVCCPQKNRVSIGVGDSCCDAIPYSSLGAQICCNGTMVERFGQQCCGGQAVADDLLCCGDEQQGQAYKSDSDRSCCGMQYVQRNTTSCCRDSAGNSKAHEYASTGALLSSNEKCCESERISSDLSCCNGIGYTPGLEVCSDVGDSDTGCGSGVVCPIGSPNAKCDTCNFNSSLSCHAVPSTTTLQPLPTATTPEGMCTTEPILIYTGLDLMYTDAPLTAWSTFEYSLSVSNRAGSASTPYQPITTAQSTPEELSPPITSVYPDRLHIIYLTWSPPRFTNGEIIRYSLTRDVGQGFVEIYRGLELAYDDDNAVQPFKTYTYKLQACTIIGCVQSDEISAATREAPPGGVQPPGAIFTNATTIQLIWQPPLTPNGIIDKYIMYQIAGGIEEQNDIIGSEERTLILSDLSPYSQHGFIISACTAVACTNSSMVTIETNQALPTGLVEPTSVVLSTTSLTITWYEPKEPNGVLTGYTLYRKDGLSMDWLLISVGMQLSVTESGLSPGTTYMYRVKITNSAGSVFTPVHSVNMPISSPGELTAPHNVTAIDAYSVYVEWSPPGNPGGLIDQYQVVLNAGLSSELSISRPADTITSYIVSGLSPHTLYTVRIRVCLSGVDSCVTGPAVFVRTLEAPPTEQFSPVVVSLGASVVEVSWMPPQHPNGVIIKYTVNRRKLSQPGNSLIVHVGDNSTLSFINAGPEILPYTEYQYQVVCENSVGSASSQWSTVHTQEAPPTNLDAPIVTVLGAFSLAVAWQQPKEPNGVILDCEISYQALHEDPTYQLPIQSLRVPGSQSSAIVGDLTPHTEYRVKVKCRNGAGDISSEWVSEVTGQSSPEGLHLMNSEPRANGRSILLSWSAPFLVLVKPNGGINEYRIYEQGTDYPLYIGINTQFDYLRLEPYTSYTVRLEACTMAGCTLAEWQMVTTREITPENQPSPAVGQANSTSVTIRWDPPLNPNGFITLYEVERLSLGIRQARNIPTPSVVYSTTDILQFTDAGLLPFSRYQYRIRAHNAGGSVESSWANVQTMQAPPLGVASPSPAYYGDSFDQLIISWTAPRVNNGIIQNYQLQRNGSIPLIFAPDAPKEYTDRSLKAFTVYSYTITACTAGGCATSEPAIIRTRESSPLVVIQPVIDAVTSNSLAVSWSAPLITNGVLTRYDLKSDGAVVYSGLNTSFTITNLVPYTYYRLILVGCTGGGCSESSSVLARTASAPPAGLEPPALRVISSSTIEVIWNEPRFSNGPISLYELYRDSELVYSGIGFVYSDTSLLPGTTYTYRVKVVNSVGSLSSSVSIATTYASSPAGLAPPTLEALTAMSVRATWSPPAKTNGIITNYTLYEGRTMDVYFTGLRLTTIVTGLDIYTMYSMRIQACTVAGCILSSLTTVTTMEASPTDLQPPQLVPQASSTGAHAGIWITWQAPGNPNGIITLYSLYRRKDVAITGSDAASYSDLTLVYSGSQISYEDRDISLEPFSFYEYQVEAENNAGAVLSPWARIRTYEGLPEGVLPVELTTAGMTHLTVSVEAPSKPNGNILSYAIVLNGSVTITSGLTMEFTISDLSPLTVYSLVLRVCTAVGCSESEGVIVMTASGPPRAVLSPAISNVTENSVRLTWQVPEGPSTTGYEIYQRSVCSDQLTTFERAACNTRESELIAQLDTNGQMSLIVDQLSPYSSYQWAVRAYNEHGTSNEDLLWSTIQSTLASDPQFLASHPLQLEILVEAFRLNWTGSFELNGRFMNYELSVHDGQSRTGFLIYEVYQTTYLTPKQLRNSQLNFYVEVRTERGAAISNTVSYTSPTSTGAITGQSTEETGVTSPVKVNITAQAWFIPIIVIGLILIAIVFFFLIRHFCGGKSIPYEREKTPLPKRQVRSVTEAHVASFHDLMGSQSVAVSNITSRTREGSTPQGLSYNKAPSSLSRNTGHAIPAYNHLDAGQQGVNIWPVNEPLPLQTTYSPTSSQNNVYTTARPRGNTAAHDHLSPPDTRISTDLGSVISESSGEFTPSEARVAKEKLVDDEDTWDSVLHDSAMYDSGSDFSESGIYPIEPTTFTDTHL